MQDLIKNIWRKKSETTSLSLLVHKDNEMELISERSIISVILMKSYPNLRDSHIINTTVSI
jgi:hypothetical protein